jgi:hypothetical protein
VVAPDGHRHAMSKEMGQEWEIYGLPQKGWVMANPTVMDLGPIS